MGLPIKTLVCASNKNNVLTDFLRVGEYNRNRDFYTTVSPSMDILISSNLERLLYTTLGADKTAEYMKKLNEDGNYRLDAADFAKISESFVGYYTDEDDCKSTVRDTYENEGSLIDTHTAVAVSAAKRYIKDTRSSRTMLVVSTASPYKFAADVYRSLKDERPESDLEAPAMLEELTGVKMPEPLRRVLTKEPIHLDVIRKDDMPHAVLEFALSAIK